MSGKQKLEQLWELSFELWTGQARQPEPGPTLQKFPGWGELWTQFQELSSIR